MSKWRFYANTAMVKKPEKIDQNSKRALKIERTLCRMLFLQQFGCNTKLKQNGMSFGAFPRKLFPSYRAALKQLPRNTSTENHFGLTTSKQLRVLMPKVDKFNKPFGGGKEVKLIKWEIYENAFSHMKGNFC